jgi:hypothetical protein
MNRNRNLLKSPRQHTILFVMLILALVTLSCASLNISNLSGDQAARVYISIGSSAKSVRVVPAAGSTMYTNDDSGTYKITVLPYTNTQDSLDFIKNNIKDKMFSGKGSLTSAQLGELETLLQGIDKEIEKSVNASSGTCSGFAGDFSNVEVKISWNAQANRWQATCSSDEGIDIYKSLWELTGWPF